MPSDFRLKHSEARPSIALLPSTPAQGATLLALLVFIALLHVVGWGTLIMLVDPLHLSMGSKAFGIGVGLTAYTLGMRHAFDADHIAAIDNTTRKLAGEGKPAVSVGFWFSLGHSTIVFALTLLLALGVHSVAGYINRENSAFHALTSVVGTSVSGAFLYLIAAFNLVTLIDIVKLFRQLRHGHFDEASLDALSERRGFLNRLLAPFMRIVSKSAHMYIVGLLFGLGFDTATEIALLVITGSGAASGLPWYATLCLPVLFAAGMLLFDTIDGSFMNVAYGWALSRPVRKIYYNIVVTSLSIGVALLIGTLEILGLFREWLDLHHGAFAWLVELDLDKIGFAIAGLFVATWLVSIAVWKLGRVEEKWAPRAQRAAASRD
ncbi:HoxN/HupN/NixA family nickel/cobalt transporter [Paraburkholderia sp. BR14320]|uniref:HoxN/HupN/NixA family nickel/cobalt transporter n=1 Tax=unclassified Paraburkholderia TaxID=2615204 RepID=UPI0034D00B70